MIESSLCCFSNKVQPWVMCVWNHDSTNDVLKVLQCEKVDAFPDYLLEKYRTNECLLKCSLEFTQFFKELLFKCILYSSIFNTLKSGEQFSAFV